MSHLKKLSWVLLGSLSHLALQQGSVESIWKPVCSDLGLNLATIVQVVLTGYLAQNKVRLIVRRNKHDSYVI